jgi:hypothetical protein
MPGPVRQSNLVQESNVATGTVSGATINGVASGNCLIALVYVVTPTSNSSDVVSAYSTTIGGSAANTWTLIARGKVLGADGVRCLEVTAWIAHNVSAGNTVGKPTLVPGSGNNVIHHVDEWSGIVTASAVDKTATATHSATSATSITAGPTATLAQTNEVVIGAVVTWLGYRYNGTGDGTGPGTPPTGLTILQGTTTNAFAVTGQSAYKDPAGSTAAVSAAWTYDNAQPSAAIIFTVKQGTTNLRLEIDNIDSTDITGTTGWTFYAWPGAPDAGAATKTWTAYSASIVSGKLVFPDAPPGATAGSTWNAMGYQPAGTLTTGFMSGTVRAF